MDLIVYHNNCPDGFAAAYVAKKKYPEAKLRPRDHVTDIDPEEYRGKDVLCVDINLRGKNDEIAKIAKSFRVFDHHKSELSELDGKDYAVFDLERSGVGLAWDNLFGKDSINIVQCVENNGFCGEGVHWSTRPWWVNYIEDRDLWKFKLPYSREINAYIQTFPYTEESWDELTKVDIEKAIEQGKAISRQLAKAAREAADQNFEGAIEIGGKIVPVLVVNAQHFMASEIGEILYNRNPDCLAMVWFERKDGKIQISLRSLAIDCGEFASTIPGGGGHPRAAGIVMSIKSGRDFIDGVLKRNYFTFEPGV